MGNEHTRVANPFSEQDWNGEQHSLMVHLLNGEDQENSSPTILRSLYMRFKSGDISKQDLLEGLRTGIGRGMLDCPIT